MMPFAVMRMRKAAVGSPYLEALYSSMSTGLASNVMFNTDGSLSILEDGVTYTYPTAWLSVHPDADTASLYEIKRVQVSGTLGVSYTGTLTSGVWYPLNSQRGITVAPGLSARENTSTWEIRLIGGDGTILESTTTTVTAEP